MASRIALMLMLGSVAIAGCTATATHASAAGPYQPAPPSQMVAVTYAPTAPASGATIEAAARLMKERAYVISQWSSATVIGQHIVVTGPATDEAALRSLAFPAAVVRLRAVLLHAAAKGKAYGDVGLVKPGVRALFDHLTCHSPAAHDRENPSAQIVSCDSGGGKYALDTATVVGEEIVDANADVTGGNQWQVTVSLDRAGTAAFAALTTRLYNHYYAGSLAGNEDDAVLDEVAVIVNGTVASADTISQPITGGEVGIYGSSVTRAWAQKLAEDLQPALPVRLRVISVRPYTLLPGTSTTVSY